MAKAANSVKRNDEYESPNDEFASGQLTVDFASGGPDFAVVTALPKKGVWNCAYCGSARRIHNP